MRRSAVLLAVAAALAVAACGSSKPAYCSAQTNLKERRQRALERLERERAEVLAAEDRIRRQVARELRQERLSEPDRCDSELPDDARVDVEAGGRRGHRRDQEAARSDQRGGDVDRRLREREQVEVLVGL